MKVYIIVYDSVGDKHPSGNPVFCDSYVYKTREVAQKYWQQLGDSRFCFSIKELELLEE